MARGLPVRWSGAQNMSTGTIVILVIVIVAIAILAWMLFRKERTKKLRSQFGPEYDRTIEQYGTANKAERDLEMRQKRMQKVNIRALTPAEREQFTDLWVE